MGLLFAVALAGTAFGQDVPMSGTVTNGAGAAIPGVLVRVQGTDIRAVTDANGVYHLTAPTDATLTFVHVGSKPFTALVAGRRTVDVTMTNVTYLEEVVVTAYTEQRRADITGAVSSANVDEAKKQTSGKRAQGAGRCRSWCDGSDERFARFAKHGPNPRHQLVSEQ